MGPMPRIVPIIAVLLVAGCSLVLEDPAPFFEPRQDMQPVDAAPPPPDMFFEEAFVPRPRFDMEAAPDAEAPDAMGGMDGDIAQPDGGVAEPDMAPEVDAEPAADAAPDAAEAEA